MFEPLEILCPISEYRILKIFDEESGNIIATPTSMTIN